MNQHFVRILFVPAVLLSLAISTGLPLTALAENNHLSTPGSAINELDEQIGDTITVGVSALDNQQNVTLGRMIAFNPYGDNGSGEVTVVFTDLAMGGDTRFVKMNRITFENGSPVAETNDGYQVSLGIRGGYATIGMAVNMEDPVPIFAYHDRSAQGQPWRAKAAAEYNLFPGLFVEYTVPYTDGVSMTQIKVAVDGDSVVHLVGGESLAAPGDPRPILYTRLTYDRETNAFQITNPDGMPEVVTDLASVSAANIAVSPDGQRVAISKILSRFQLGLIEEPSGSDHILWVNDNRGLDWDFDADMINVTQFQGPDPDLLPDEMAANVDTFRADNGNTIFFDEDNVLHYAFEVYPYFHYPDQTGYIFGQVYYWNEVDQYYVRIADGNFFLNAGVTSYGAMTCKPSLYKDPETGYLWCLYQQFGEPGDTLADGSAMDAGESSGLLNADLYITASPPGEFNGKLWFKGINITNTKGTTGNIPPGECRHERDATIALNNDGDYLNISYLLDLDAGNFDNGNGTMTDNPVVYQRVSKQELLDLFDEQAEFIRGYPLHVDETGYWVDEEDWAWRDLNAVGETKESARPTDFEIAAVYPNPFNSRAKITFTMRNPGTVHVAVYDLLGREAHNADYGYFRAGTHHLTFDGSRLASGVYFVRLESGNSASRTVKIVLLK